MEELVVLVIYGFISFFVSTLIAGALSNMLGIPDEEKERAKEENLLDALLDNTTGIVTAVGICLSFGTYIACGQKSFGGWLAITAILPLISWWVAVKYFYPKLKFVNFCLRWNEALTGRFIQKP